MVPSAIQRVLDQIFTNGLQDSRNFLYGIIFIGGLFLAKEIFNCLRIRVNNKLEQKVILKIRKSLHDKLLDLPINFYDRRKSGDIASRVVEDVQNVERAILDGTEQGSYCCSNFIWSYNHDVCTRAPPCISCVSAFANLNCQWHFVILKISKKNWKAVREASGNLNSLLVEDIQGNRLIHSFDLKSREKDRFMVSSKELEFRSLKAMYRWSIQGPSASFTSSLGILAVVGMGAYLLETDSSFTKGQFFAFLLYANMFYEPVRQLVSINNMVSAGKASGERVFEILDEEIFIKNPVQPIPFPKKIIH